MALRLFTRRIFVGGDTSITLRSKSYWGKIKDSKAGTWSRSLLSDYKEACSEMVVGMWEHPVKASVSFTVLGGVFACFSSKPDYSSFEAALLKHANQLGLLSSWIRNATSDSHVQSLLQLRNEGRLFHVNLGLLSLIYFTDHSPDTTLYEAHCSSLAKQWREFPRCIMDVGFVGRWWNLDSKMTNYDINEDEFLHLPEHLKVSATATVRIVESNEQLHKESWFPLKSEAKEK
ncbi:mitochondrial import inner membrane translocase subunit Tim29 [Stigmatopora argus]